MEAESQEACRKTVSEFSKIVKSKFNFMLEEIWVREIWDFFALNWENFPLLVFAAVSCGKGLFEKMRLELWGGMRREASNRKLYSILYQIYLKFEIYCDKKIVWKLTQFFMQRLSEK